MLEFELDKRGQPGQKFRVGGQAPRKASDLAQWPETEGARLTLRSNEGGMLLADFAMCSAWVVSTKGAIREETWLMKRNRKDIRYRLSNAPSTTPLRTLAQRQCQRYLVERSIQDAQSERGLSMLRAAYLAFLGSPFIPAIRE